ncbi:HIT family protein [Methylobacillus gramineus]|uniref:HIT family protein n=1 Tax=Methylobacillus gramineus TaxID=755169 RepID=UPI001CFF81BD|nr:HIT family protein [Methylobacillus gramineus]MCB5186144.1 HIT family protein [Methylobacillus gramineus]
MNCPFCTPEKILFSNQHAYARYDGFPVSEGHILIIPFRHVENYFDLTQEEQQDILSLLNQAKAHLDRTFEPDGYNVGINVGQPAGQTIMHVHCHLIPRYIGDIPDPRGGIRAVIPDKKSY